MREPLYVGVIGAGSCSDSVYELARSVGRGIGEKGWTLVCGGLGGVMEGAARGCFESGGKSVGLLPGIQKDSANRYITMPIPTGLGEARNVLVVRASDALVSISGGYGTLSEIGLALKMGKLVIGLNTWKEIHGVEYVSTPSEAIRRLSDLLSFEQ
ncbi:MAG: TIGR00725 family protein [Deltaproteobacteria bacterium]|nr:TIGR00725 family protein [Deltaproteobacteria bacterium]MBW1919267.1 TIGR00725 family protein [Deltaproteobacteria bacterium]MBW1935088.1 TIGR00725 family protein [Deltaproteobacteria bacterium]MBW1977652.1 TIGR00725 family protein [Deltaproteobacteria bacterium]MBW2044974.1 TIGR00725 family protein [Deltaproteobacteria bacterium]